MKRIFEVLIITGLLAGFSLAQKKPPLKRPSPPRTALKNATALAIDLGEVSGRTYMNKTLSFELTFPDTWLIPSGDFDAEMKKQGFDLSLKAPENIGLTARANLNKLIKQIQVLVTAYRAMPGSVDNAIIRISAEDLKTNPQIKDAVDYIDAVRQTYKAISLPADFKYSETQAEQLGRKQFAFLDTSSSAGKKRMYATVRKGFAILFTISYTRSDDLETLRQVLSNGNFSLR